MDWVRDWIILVHEGGFSHAWCRQLGDSMGCLWLTVSKCQQGDSPGRVASKAETLLLHLPLCTRVSVRSGKGREVCGIYLNYAVVIDTWHGGVIDQRHEIRMRKRLVHLASRRRVGSEGTTLV